MSENEQHQLEEDLAYKYSMNIYSFLKSKEDVVKAIQNTLLFISPMKSVIFFFSINLIFISLYLCNFSLFSYLFLFASLKSIPSRYLVKILNGLCRYFSKVPEKEKKGTITPISIDNISCLCGIIFLNFKKRFLFYIDAVKYARLFDIAFITILLFFSFYLIYAMGDAFFVWFCIHLSCLVPIVLTKRIGFELFHFPTILEKNVLQRMKKKIEEDEKIRLEEEALHKQQEALKTDEEVRMLTEIAIHSEETAVSYEIDEADNNDKKTMPRSQSNEVTVEPQSQKIDIKEE